MRVLKRSGSFEDVSFDDTYGFSETECLLSIPNRDLNSLKSIVDEINQYYSTKGKEGEYISLTNVGDLTLIAFAC